MLAENSAAADGLFSAAVEEMPTSYETQGSVPAGQ